MPPVSSPDTAACQPLPSEVQASVPKRPARYKPIRSGETNASDVRNMVEMVELYLQCDTTFSDHVEALPSHQNVSRYRLKERWDCRWTKAVALFPIQSTPILRCTTQSVSEEADFSRDVLSHNYKRLPRPHLRNTRVLHNHEL